MNPWLVIFGLVIGAALIACLAHAAKRVGIVALAWRFLSGQPWHGRPYTDAGWLRPASRVLHSSGHAGRWHHLPRLARAGIRTGAVMAIVDTAIGWRADRSATLTGLRAAAALAALCGLWRAWRAARGFRLDRAVLRPLAAPLAVLIGVTEPAARKAITLKPAYASIKEGEVGRVTLPPAFHAAPEQRKAVQHLVSSRLPVDVNHRWDTRQTPQVLTLLAAPECSTMVPFADMAAEMAKCKPSEVVIGLDRHDHVFRGSFNLDDPHWGFSVGSGRGKSTMLMLSAAQLLHQEPDGDVTGIDPKMTSFDPLVGVPGVTIANDPRNMGEWDRESQRHTGGMWGAVDDWIEDMMNRLDILKQDPTARFPISLLMLDEVNQFSAMTAAIWRNVKARDEPATPPIWMKIASGCWMGRAVRKHVVMVGQRLDDKATGGIGLRDSLGFRGLAGFRAQQWDMLIGTRPVPRSQKPKGRWIYSDGQTETWVQNMMADPGEIRDYAMAGIRSGARSGVPLGTGTRPLTGSNAATGTGTWVVGLEAAAAVLGLSTETFKKRRQRAGGTVPGEMRRGNQPAWTESDLITWAGQDSVSAA